MSYSRPTLTVDFSFNPDIGKCELTITSSHDEMPANEKHLLTGCSVYELVHIVCKAAKPHKHHLELAEGCSEELIRAVQHCLKHGPIDALEAKINAVEKQIYPSSLRKLLETYESEYKVDIDENKSSDSEQKFDLRHATGAIIDIYKLPGLIRQHNEDVNVSLYGQEANTFNVGSLFLTVALISAAAIMWYCWPILPLTKTIIVSCFGGVVTGGLFGTVCELLHQFLTCFGCIALPTPLPNSDLVLGRLLEFPFKRDELEQSSSTSRFFKWFLMPRSNRVSPLSPLINNSSAEQKHPDPSAAPLPLRSPGPVRVMLSPQSSPR